MLGPGCSENTIINNDIVSNRFGVQISKSKNNLIIGNFIFENMEGMSFRTSNSNTILNNTYFLNSEIGLRLDADCYFNEIYNNNFISNANQVDCYHTENHWDYGYPIVVLAMIVIGIFLTIYFRRKEWI